MNDLMKFDFNGHNVSAQIDENRQGLFLAKDLCECLGLKNVSMAMKSLDDDEKLISTILMSGQKRDMWFVTEAGSYQLAILSRTEEARKFKRWLTHDVIPAIRTGKIVPDSAVLKSFIKDYTEMSKKLYEQQAESTGLINKAADVIRHYRTENARLHRDNMFYRKIEQLQSQVAKIGRPLSREEQEKALQLAEIGFSAVEIALNLNRNSAYAVRSYLKKVQAHDSKTSQEETV